MNQTFTRLPSLMSLPKQTLRLPAAFSRAAFRRQQRTVWRRASPQAVASSEDEVLRTISDNGQVSVMVVKGTNLVREVSNKEKQHSVLLGLSF